MQLVEFLPCQAEANKSRWIFDRYLIKPAGLEQINNLDGNIVE